MPYEIRLGIVLHDARMHIEDNIGKIEGNMTYTPPGNHIIDLLKRAFKVFLEFIARAGTDTFCILS
jgi:hypothetical protein